MVGDAAIGVVELAVALHESLAHRLAEPLAKHRVEVVNVRARDPLLGVLQEALVVLKLVAVRAAAFAFCSEIIYLIADTSAN